MNKASIQHNDIRWALSLFGTAVGAGILFLPIDAGLHGVWPFITLAIVTAPLVYWSHHKLACYIYTGKNNTTDIIGVTEQHFGKHWRYLVTFLYFLAIYPILLIYGIGATNTVISFLKHQLHVEALSRPLIAFITVVGMSTMMQFKQSTLLRITEIIVYPLAFILLCLSLALIPFWQVDNLLHIPPASDFAHTLWITLPTLVFAFNHSPAISTFTVAMKKTHPHNTLDKIHQILMLNSSLLFFFVFLFVLSCIMVLSPDAILEAKSQNISVLSYFANHFENPLFNTIAPIIAMTAIVSSFFGHYAGAKEGLRAIIQTFTHINPASKTMDALIYAFFSISLWFAAFFNPSVLGLIEVLVGPMIALILFLLPVYAIYNIPALRTHRHTMSTAYTFTIGLLTLLSLVTHIAYN